MTRLSAIGEHRLLNLAQSAILLGGMTLLLAVLGWLFAGTAGLAWITVLGLVAMIFGSRVSPNLLLRLYRARPLQPGEVPALEAVAAELAERAGLSAPPALYYVPSRMLQAFTVVQSGRPAIAVTDGLLRGLALRETASVLAHELSHVRHGDLRILMLADLVTKMTRMLAFLGILLLFFNLPLVLAGAVAVPWAAVLLLVFAPTVSTLLQLALSRTREFDADLGAVELTGDPDGLAAALTRLDRYQGAMWEQILMPGYKLPQPSLLRTHPATEERVTRLAALPRGRPLASLAHGVAAQPAIPPVARAPLWRPWRFWY